jgi:hypothetical protein
LSTSVSQECAALTADSSFDSDETAVHAKKKMLIMTSRATLVTLFFTVPPPLFFVIDSFSLLFYQDRSFHGLSDTVCSSAEYALTIMILIVILQIISLNNALRSIGITVKTQMHTGVVLPDVFAWYTAAVFSLSFVLKNLFLDGLFRMSIILFIRIIIEAIHQLPVLLKHLYHKLIIDTLVRKNAEV